MSRPHRPPSGKKKHRSKKRVADPQAPPSRAPQAPRPPQPGSPQELAAELRRGSAPVAKPDPRWTRHVLRALWCFFSVVAFCFTCLSGIGYITNTTSASQLIAQIAPHPASTFNDRIHYGGGGGGGGCEGGCRSGKIAGLGSGDCGDGCGSGNTPPGNDCGDGCGNTPPDNGCGPNCNNPAQGCGDCSGARTGATAVGGQLAYIYDYDVAVPNVAESVKAAPFSKTGGRFAAATMYAPGAAVGKDLTRAVVPTIAAAIGHASDAHPCESRNCRSPPAENFVTPPMQVLMSLS